MAHEKLTIVIFGDSQHSEVRGLLGWAGESAIATLDSSSLLHLCAARTPATVGILSQTTQRVEDYTSFAQRACAMLVAHGREVRVVNTLCAATRRRQAAAADLARRVDAMVVIGGRRSANTQRLAETCAEIVQTFLVESAEEIDASLLTGKGHVGLTAGASTPDSSIERAERRLRAL